ncbi:MAG: hypothetical protein WC993_06970 [Methanoculleus sp.]
MTPAKDIIRASILDPPFRGYHLHCPRRGAGEERTAGAGRGGGEKRGAYS